MFSKFQRRNNRKARLSSWFASERDRDMQTLDVGAVATSVGIYVSAVMREKAVRRSSRAAATAFAD